MHYMQLTLLVLSLVHLSVLIRLREVDVDARNLSAKYAALMSPPPRLLASMYGEIHTVSQQ